MIPSKAILALLLALSPLMLTASEIIKKASPYDVQTTMDRLESAIKAKSITVFARVDHKNNAHGVDMKMNDNQVIIFGKPQIGTRLMRHDPGVGLDLPMRVAVYKDYDNVTWISYHNPKALQGDYDLDECRAVEQMAFVMNALTDKVIEPLEAPEPIQTVKIPTH